MAEKDGNGNGYTEKRKRFFPQVSLGSVIATVAFLASGVGIYTQVIADVNTAKIEIINLKQNEVKREQDIKDSRTEIRQEIREVKQSVEKTNDKLDKVLQELLRSRNESRR